MEQKDRQLSASLSEVRATLVRDTMVLKIKMISGSTTLYIIPGHRRPISGGTARVDAVGFSIGSKGYIGTGYDGTNKNDYWSTTLSSILGHRKLTFGGTARQAAVGFSIGSKGYIGTGYDGTNKMHSGNTTLSSILGHRKLDFGGTARFNAVGFSIGDKGYIGTGAYYGL